jgi:phage gpG-like protein
MITVYTEGVGEVVARLDRFGPSLREQLRAEISQLSIKLQTKVKNEKLAGQVLKVRTGRLRRSIQQAVESEGERVAGVVSTNVVYARVHEYGIDETVTVKAHMRRSRAQMKLAKFKKNGLETAGSKARFAGAGDVSVREHSMHMKLPARSFLRTSLEEMSKSGEIRAGIENAIRKAAQ